MSQIEVKTRVAFKKSFLQSTGQITGNVPLARGTVAKITTYGGGSSKIATVVWDLIGVPGLVNVANLSVVDPDKGIADE